MPDAERWCASPANVEAFAAPAATAVPVAFNSVVLFIVLAVDVISVAALMLVAVVRGFVVITVTIGLVVEVMRGMVVRRGLAVDVVRSVGFVAVMRMAGSVRDLLVVRRGALMVVVLASFKVEV